MAEAVDEAAVTVKGGKRDIVKVRNLLFFSFYRARTYIVC